jgi:hypothetical protein
MSRACADPHREIGSLERFNALMATQICPNKRSRVKIN